MFTGVHRSYASSYGRVRDFRFWRIRYCRRGWIEPGICAWFGWRERFGIRSQHIEPADREVRRWVTSSRLGVAPGYLSSKRLVANLSWPGGNKTNLAQPEFCWERAEWIASTFSAVATEGGSKGWGPEGAWQFNSFNDFWFAAFHCTGGYLYRFKNVRKWLKWRLKSLFFLPQNHKNCPAAGSSGPRLWYA